MWLWHDSIMHRGRTALVAATLLLVIAGCTSAVPGSGYTVSTSVHTGGFPSAAFPRTVPAPQTSTARSGPTVTELIARFVGRWFGHGRGMTIASGSGQMEYRVYKFCTTDPTPPCDEMQHDQIIDGGRIAFGLTDAYAAGNATIAIGEIVATTVPDFPVGRQLTARLQTYRITLDIFPDAPFCSNKAPASIEKTCGA